MVISQSLFRVGLSDATLCVATLTRLNLFFSNVRVPRMTHRWLRRVTLTVLLVFVGQPGLTAWAQSATATEILYHEGVRFDRQLGAVNTQDSTTEHWSFSAMGRDFNLLLSPNTRLIDSLRSGSRGNSFNTTRLLKGQMQGVPSSWVRLTQSPAGITALIFDGQSLFAIEPQQAVSAVLSTPEADAEHVLYPLSQVFTSPLFCASESKMVSADTSVQAQMDSVVESLQASTSGTRTLDLAVYVQNWTGDVLARLNAVDGIFTQELGISLNVVSVENGNYANIGGGNEVREFRDSVVPINGRATANHLFINDTNAVSWAGIALVGALCGGAGISKMVGNLASEVTLIAHELGHNFGARHDGQADGCPSVPNAFIMWPRINNTTGFSNCSIAAMQSTINASLGECLVNTTTTLSLSPVTVNEAAGNATVTVSLSQGLTVPVSVTVFTRSQSATTGQDFYGKSERVQIPAGATSAQFTIVILEDAAVEGAESFQVRMVNAQNATIASDTTTVTIVDNDTGGQSSLSIRPVSVTERNTVLNIPVELSAPTTQAVQVTAFTRSGSALTGRDFYGTTQTLTFAPGTVRQFLRVTVLDDAVVEGQEVFQARLTGAQGASLAVPVASIVINDNDSAVLPTLSIASPTVPENAGVATVLLNLSRSHSAVVRATVFTRAGSAQGGRDYYGQTRSVEFQPGETQKPFSVTVLNDSDREGPETFSVRATSVQGAVSDVAPGIVTINDDD